MKTLNQATIRKLGELVSEANGIESDYLIERWSLRVKMFLHGAVGDQEANYFSSLSAGNSWDTMALQIGYLEGLAALAEESGNSQILAKSERPLPLVEGRQVFIVHGHDEAAKESVARFIEKVGLKPVILHEQPNGGRTIIEKFETYSKEAVFAVVLLTPDDLACEAAASPDLSQLKPRARQNVIMELGYFIGRLGRTRVCALHKGNVELPSDYQGVLYVPMDSGGAWKTKLAQEFNQSKISFDLKGLLGQ